VQTQNGEWWAVVLGKRLIEGEAPLSRETFFCKVQFENGTPIFNPGFGKVLLEQKRHNLPWTPVPADPVRDDFNGESLALYWHFVRMPQQPFYKLGNGTLTMNLMPETVESLVCAPMVIWKIAHHRFYMAAKLHFLLQFHHTVPEGAVGIHQVFYGLAGMDHSSMIAAAKMFADRFQ
jgi:xylan 1,4-beta-xylosidase